jgi:hypothetical protein
MKTKIIDELHELLGEKAEEAAATGPEAAIAQHIALAAQVAGVDLSDDDALDDFMAQVKTVVTKDKSWLKSQLRRWTTGKARAAVKATKGAM